MLAREIFYNYSSANAGIFAPIVDWFVKPDQTTASPTNNTAATGISPYVGTTTTDPFQSSFRFPVLSRHMGTPGQSNSPSVLNAGLPITTPT